MSSHMRDENKGSDRDRKGERTVGKWDRRRDGVEHYHDLLLKSRLKSALGSLKLKSLLLCALRLKTGWGKKILLLANYQKAKLGFTSEGTMTPPTLPPNVVGPTLMVASHWGAHFASALRASHLNSLLQFSTQHCQEKGFFYMG